MDQPRPEYPRPQLSRADWLNLNGKWEFAFDPNLSGIGRGLVQADSLPDEIIVPFCPESSLSGIGDVDFHAGVWYRKEVTLPDNWEGRRVLLHLGAVDHDATVWVNGQQATTHQGGYTPFSCDITGLLTRGKNVLTVFAQDDTRSPLTATGKQSTQYASYGCVYTRTTGIWQTVWLEPVPQTYIGGLRLTPDLEIPPDPPEVVRSLAAEDLLPAIYFLFSRRAVEEAAESCQRLSLLPRSEAMAVRRMARDQLESLPPEDRDLDQLQRLLVLLPKGIGFHHAGLLPPFKILVEELLATGKLKVVFATDTLALGINVPARSVVVGEMVKFDGQTRRLLSPGEYRQLTGRAGRRGMDPVGYSILLHSPWVGLDRALEIATGDVAPLESAFRPGYSTVLNLWRRPEDEERLARLIAGSLQQFHDAGLIRSLAEERDELASALAGIPSGCILDGGSTNWLEREKMLKREQERAEAAMERATRQVSALARAGKAESLAAAEQGASAARERLLAASQALARSPCRSCDLRASHRRSERQRRSFASLLVGVERDLEIAQKDSHRRARRTLRSLRSVMEALGYLCNGHPTTKARALMRLFDSNSLTISELLDWGVLADASAAEVAEVASWFAFDRDGSGKALALTERLARMRAAAEAVSRKVLEVERRFGVDLSSPLAPDFRGVGLAWATGASLSDLSARTGLAEGDIVFAIQKTIDLCRQIGQAAAFSRSPSLARKAAEAERLLRRGVVDSYYRWVVGREITPN